MIEWCSRKNIRLVLFFLPVIVLLTAVATGAQETADDPIIRITELKNEYAQKAEGEDDREKLAALALAYSGRVWSLAGRSLAEKYGRTEELSRLIQLEKNLEDADRADFNEMGLAGIRLMYEALATSAVVKSTADMDSGVLNEARTIDGDVALKTNGEKDPSYAIAVLMNGTMSMLALNTRLANTKSGVDKNVRGIFDDATMGAKAVNNRDDLHFHGRLLLLTLNGAKAGVRLCESYALALDRQLIRETGPILDTWRKKLETDLTPPAEMAVTLTALAELSFPTAMTQIQRW